MRNEFISQHFGLPSLCAEAPAQCCRLHCITLWLPITLRNIFCPFGLLMTSGIVGWLEDCDGTPTPVSFFLLDFPCMLGGVDSLLPRSGCLLVVSVDVDGSSRRDVDAIAVSLSALGSRSTGPVRYSLTCPRRYGSRYSFYLMYSADVLSIDKKRMAVSPSFILRITFHLIVEST